MRLQTEFPELNENQVRRLKLIMLETLRKSLVDGGNISNITDSYIKRLEEL